MARQRSSPSGGRSGGGSSSAGSRRSARSRLRSWLPSRTSYAAAEGVTLAAIVTYDVMQAGASPGAEPVKLPRPGPIVATMGFYALLAAFGSVSRSFEPVVVGIGWLLALSVLVTGRRGAGLLGLLQKLAGYVGKLGGDQTEGGS